MQRDEQVRLGRARPLHALAQIQVDIALAGEHGPEPRGRFQHLLQPPPEREHHVLLARARSAERARIATAVPGIDRDHQVPARGGPLLLLPGGGATAIDHVDHEAVAVLAVGLQQEALRSHLALHVEDDPQIALAPLRAANAPDQRRRRCARRQVLGQAHVLDVHDHAMRPGQGEDLVLDRPGQVEHQPRALLVGGHAHAGQGGIGGDRQRQREQDRQQQPPEQGASLGQC